MDIDTEARLAAIELMLANIIAEALRQTPDPTETAAQALRSMLRQADERAYEGTIDEREALRVRTGDTMVRVMRVALARAVADI